MTGVSVPSLTATNTHMPSYRQSAGYGTETDGTSTTNGTAALGGMNTGYNPAAAGQSTAYTSGSYGGYGATQGYRPAAGSNSSVPGSHY